MCLFILHVCTHKTPLNLNPVTLLISKNLKKLPRTSYFIIGIDQIVFNGKAGPTESMVYKHYNPQEVTHIWY